MQPDYLQLLPVAFQLTDSIKQRFGVSVDFRWGGGTVMRLRHSHRESRDIDLFVDDPQWLGYFSARLNDTVDEIASYIVEQANFVKIYLSNGEIDIVVAPTVTENPVTYISVAGQKIKVESDEEIVAKKVIFRSAEFSGRDVFDLYFLKLNDPEAYDRVITLGGNDCLSNIADRLNLESVRRQFHDVRKLSFHPDLDAAFNAIAMDIHESIGASQSLKPRRP